MSIIRPKSFYCHTKLIFYHAMKNWEHSIDIRFLFHKIKLSNMSAIINKGNKSTSTKNIGNGRRTLDITMNQRERNKCSIITDEQRYTMVFGKFTNITMKTFHINSFEQ